MAHLLVHAQPEPVMARALARERHDVLTLAADERPVRFLRVFKPHVVLIATPDAVATCRELRRESPQVSIVAILAGHDLEEMIAVLESGADDCVPRVGSARRARRADPSRAAKSIPRPLPVARPSSC